MAYACLGHFLYAADGVLDAGELFWRKRRRLLCFRFAERFRECSRTLLRGFVMVALQNS